MFRSETLRDIKSPCPPVSAALPECAQATPEDILANRPLRPFNLALVDSNRLTYDEVMAWRTSWCAYRNAYNHEEPAVHNEELAQYAREAPYHVQHQRMAGKYADTIGNYQKAFSSDRSSNPMRLTDVALRDFTIATAKEDTTGILRAFEYAGWDIKE
jgi:hypothetical protein